MIQAIIIDEDVSSIESLKSILSSKFSDIEVCECSIMKKAIELISKIKPHIIFFNIPKDQESSFEILDNISHNGYRVIFTSEFNQFASQAFDYNAVDYLLKPVSEEKLNRAIKKYKNQELVNDVVEDSLRNVLSGEFTYLNHKRILLHTSQNVHLVSLGEIIRCEADKNYTYFYLTNSKKITVSKNIDKYVTLLEPFGFIRPHKSHLVNTCHIVTLKKSNGGNIICSDNSIVPVSIRKRKETVDFLNNKFLCNE